MAETDLRRAVFEAEPVHDETYLYGMDFYFEREVDDPAVSLGIRRYAGSLGVGGLLKETEDIEGVRVRYSVVQVFPPIVNGSVTGEFVMQTFTLDRLAHRADRAVEILREKQLIDSMTDLVATESGALQSPNESSTFDVISDDRYL